VAMLVLDRDQTAALAEHLGVAAGARDSAQLSRDPQIRAEIEREVQAVNQRLARIEQVKRFSILDHDLTQAGGELTPTMKVKRASVYDKYAGVFAALYDDRGRS